MNDQEKPTGASRSRQTLPERAAVVVVGGGIVGASIAYHLTKRGVADVVVLEQSQLTSGSTWHAAGLVSQLKSSQTLTTLSTYSARLYERLEDETGQATGYRTPGSISVAADPERWEELLRGMSMARAMGIAIEPIGLDEVAERFPLARTDDLVGALYIPDDGLASPVDTTMALAKGARSGGARIVEGVGVERVIERDHRVVGVETTDGQVIEADTVVLACGVWTRQLAATAGVTLPAQACEHYYLVTAPIEGVHRDLPTLRDPGNYTYFKQETGKLMVGFFEPRGKVWQLDGVPRDFSFGTIDPDWDHVGPIFERAIERVPALADAGIQLLFNGPEAFTPDGHYHLGEAPEVDGVFVAAGFNSVGIQSAGGVGWVLADWIVDGHPPMDLAEVDVRRTFAFQTEPSYLAERIPESLGLLYAMHWPFRQYESARGVRTSALHDRIDDAGAVFGETAGWERPNWYAEPGQAREYVYSFGKQNWHPNMEAECRAARDAVALFDQSSFAKFRVAGPDALAVLDHLSANQIDTDPGRGVYTQWLNERGGIEADLTVNRLADDEFMVVTSAACETRDWARLLRAGRGRAVEIVDVTDDFTVLGVMGPKARSVLAGLTPADLSNEAFAFGDTRAIEVAGRAVRALRMSYVGELGWELYVPVADAGAVYDAIVAAGAPYGLRHAGYHAMNSLRLEAGYRHWGHDITDHDTPLEAGLGFAVAWDKPGGFVGREALAEQRERPRRRRLVQFRLEDPDRLLYHDEPIRRDGAVVGRVTSGMWSVTEGRCLAMGYARRDDSDGGVDKAWLDEGHWDIEVAGERIAVTPSLRSFYDPTNQRVKM